MVTVVKVGEGYNGERRWRVTMVTVAKVGEGYHGDSSKSRRGLLW